MSWSRRLDGQKPPASQLELPGWCHLAKRLPKRLKTYQYLRSKDRMISDHHLWWKECILYASENFWHKLTIASLIVLTQPSIFNSTFKLSYLFWAGPFFDLDLNSTTTTPYASVFHSIPPKHPWEITSPAGFPPKSWGDWNLETAVLGLPACPLVGRGNWRPWGTLDSPGPENTWSLAWKKIVDMNFQNFSISPSVTHNKSKQIYVNHTNIW